MAISGVRVVLIICASYAAGRLDAKWFDGYGVIDWQFYVIPIVLAVVFALIVSWPSGKRKGANETDSRT